MGGLDGGFTGGCLCGQLRYTVTGPPLWVCNCHCASCRRFTGSAMTTFVGVKPEHIAFEGELGRYDSSSDVPRCFCPRCGASVHYEAERFGREVQLHVGTLDDPGRFAPQMNVHVAERVPWLTLADHLPSYPGSSLASPPLEER